MWHLVDFCVHLLTQSTCSCAAAPVPAHLWPLHLCHAGRKVYLAMLASANHVATMQLQGADHAATRKILQDSKLEWIIYSDPGCDDAKKHSPGEIGAGEEKCPPAGKSLKVTKKTVLGNVGAYPELNCEGQRSKFLLLYLQLLYQDLWYA